MYFGTPHRALLRSIVAGAAMLAAAACSRSDRAGTGSDTTQVQSGAAAPTDTQSVATPPTSTNQATPGDTSATGMKNNPAPTSTSERTSNTGKAPVSGYRAMGQDTSSVNDSAQASGASRDTVAVGDSSHIGKTGNRLEPTAASGQANADTVSSQADSTRIRPPEDSTETVGTAATDSGAPEMARDTTTSLAQADTTAPQPSDTAAAQVAQDSSVVQAQVDTTQQTEMAQQAPVDSAAPVQAQVDTSAAANDTVSAGQSSETAQQPADTAAAAGAAGVQTGKMATGADAVALVTREGRRCTVVTDAAERRDLASSPATLNPCGTGTMTLPRVQVEEER